ncbi:MAG TPA: UDP-glucuronic acid decarboxylase family protein [Chloroflexota bacterium]|nr:UDP-glucuronic acid decarboxylase family protein [Chloroflexota bacterium]
MNVLVAGGAGFIGSHLCESLLSDGHSVICLDNFYTGRRENVSGLTRQSSFELIEHDLVRPLPRDWQVDAVFNLASPASPVGYLNKPIETAMVNSLGTYHLLKLALTHGARFLQASTSEVYGDPLVHPQAEGYWGNVNPRGPRACYDEGKRFAEALTMDFHRVHGLDVRLVRIFNTYGPRSQADDGRVIPSFVCKALAGEPLPIYGDGQQTRSFCFVADLVRGLKAVMFGDGLAGEVFNLGNPGEFTLLELADLVRELSESTSELQFLPAREDDPTRRRPDISKVTSRLGWRPLVPLPEGLLRTIGWFKGELSPLVGSFAPCFA